MAPLNTRQQKELAATIRQIVCDDITSALDLQLKPVNVSLSVLTAKVDTYSTKLESREDLNCSPCSGTRGSDLCREEDQLLPKP